jgi:hypothetical protein
VSAGGERFGPAARGDHRKVSVLRYLAILSAARDFGVSTSDLARVARRFDPLTVSPEELADVLAELTPERMGECSG